MDCVYSLMYNAPTMLPTGRIVGALYHKLWTQSSAPEDGRNYRPKHELILIINKIIIVASSWLFILLYFVQLSDPKIFHEMFPNHLQFSITSQLSSPLSDA